MKKDNKQSIYDVYDLICQRDPDWKHGKMFLQFKTLYDGWRAVELRHKVRTAGFYTRHWREKMLPLLDWERFRDYAMQ